MNEKNQLLQLLKANEKIQRYLVVEQEINENQSLKQQVNKLKKIQKELVKAREFNLENKLFIIEVEYQIISENINTTPLISEYFTLQDYVNQLIAEISETFMENLQNNE